MEHLVVYSGLIYRVELCSVMLTLSSELKSVNLRHAVWGYWGVLSFLVLCPCYHGCFFSFTYTRIVSCVVKLSLKWLLYFPSFILSITFWVICIPELFSVFSHLLSQDVVGCNISPVDGFQSRDESLSYLCNVVSKEDGSFSFLSLPSGKYTVVCLFIHWVVNFCFLL